MLAESMGMENPYGTHLGSVNECADKAHFSSITFSHGFVMFLVIDVIINLISQLSAMRDTLAYVLDALATTIT